MNDVSEQAKQPRFRGTLWKQLLSREDWLVAGWAIGMKLVLYLFGAETFVIYEDKPLPIPEGWMQIWNRWDSLHYLDIAQRGYAADPVSKAFYPLFPWITRFVAHFTSTTLQAAFITSGIASVAAIILLRRLAQLEYSAAVARRTVWFFLIFPTSYFFHIGYSESLFLALALGSVLAARRNHWAWAGPVGALCWMTRPLGAALVPALAVEAAHQWWTTRRWNWRWLWIAIVPAGFAVYLLINWKLTGNPWAFVEIRKKIFIQEFSYPWAGIHSAIGNLHRNPSQGEMVGRMELIFAMLGLVCTIVSWFKLRPIYATWMTVSWLLATSVTFLQSTPRYALTMFPIFMVFALATRNALWRGLLSVVSLLYLAVFSILYVRGWWAF